MTEAEHRALRALSFNWAPTPDDVWRRSEFHVEGLHERTEAAILAGVAEAERSADASPIGLAVLGQRGSGKTHLLGWVREQTQQRGGYFFLISLLDASTFWRSSVLAMLDGLARESPGQGSQLHCFLRRLAELVAAPRAVRRAVTGEGELSRASLDAFTDLVRKASPQVGLECQNTLRGLVLRGAESFREQDVGYNYLSGSDEEEPGERAAWGIRRGRRSPQETVREISQLIALTGPTVVAVDQIDLLIAQSMKSTAASEAGAPEWWPQALLIEQIAGGLMSLREWTRRTLSVVTCLPRVWELVKDHATDTVQDRFREAVRLKEIPTPALAEQLVAKRFAVRFAELGFTPPYPTWPVRPEAFAEAVGFTPRELLMTVDAHLRSSPADGEVQELDRLVRRGAGAPAPSPVDGDVTPAALAALDREFADRVAAADPAPALAQETEDSAVPALLAAGLVAWITEREAGAGEYQCDPLPGPKPELHARLRRSLDEAYEDEAHWSFRAVAAAHPIAALNRVRNAITAAGLTEGAPKRRLILLRNDPWSPGPRTTEVISAFEAVGGRVLRLPEADVRCLTALRGLLADRGPEALRPWLRARRPTRDIAVLREALASAGTVPPPALPVDHEPGDMIGADRGAEPHDQPGGSGGGADDPPAPNQVTVGDGGDGQPPVTIPLAALRRHTVIFAGSGSGKTVLIRRLVEECAVQGVSAIVLDPNNDLARLGEPWPTVPDGWGAGDAARAADYLDHTDVVVWTPGRESARPLSFQPLPDFQGVLAHPDEFRQAVDAAVASLAPRARLVGNTSKVDLRQAVLRQALTHHARQGGAGLADFLALLAALPSGVSEFENAEKIAAELGQTLTAAVVNDPLFAGAGTPVDPGVLLSPPAGKRARVSVISFVGLPSDLQRQSFVNQLQLALFAWIKQHPAGDRPLGGLFVMDEAQTLAPSGPMTACTYSTLALSSQARKYGLGLIFATQAPKALHNRIPGNASTQFFGRLNVPVQISAAQELARSKGGEVPDIGRLRAGQFYTTVDGGGFARIQSRLCLSHHPASALTAEEVLARATPTLSQWSAG